MTRVDASVFLRARSQRNLSQAKRGVVEILACFADTLNIGYLDRYLHSL